MKKLILTFLLVCGSAIAAMAAKETLYELYEDGREDVTGSTYYVIDRDAKTFRFDSDSEEEGMMVMKNYKKSGSTETFDCYFQADPKTYHCSVKIAPNSAGATVINIIYKKANYTRSYVVGDKAALDEFNKSRKKSTSKSSKEEVSSSSLTDKAKDKAKGLFNKGKNLIKKK